MAAFIWVQFETACWVLKSFFTVAVLMCYYCSGLHPCDGQVNNNFIYFSNIHMCLKVNIHLLSFFLESGDMSLLLENPSYLQLGHSAHTSINVFPFESFFICNQTHITWKYHTIIYMLSQAEWCSSWQINWSWCVKVVEFSFYKCFNHYN